MVPFFSDDGLISGTCLQKLLNFLEISLIMKYEHSAEGQNI